VTPDWDLPSPFIHPVSAIASDIDAYGHVNNSVYLRWLDETAWAHSAALGVTAAHCVTTRRGMVVWRSQMHYQAPAFAGNALEVGTWLVFEDARLRVDRAVRVAHVELGEDRPFGFPDGQNRTVERLFVALLGNGPVGCQQYQCNTRQGQLETSHGKVLRFGV